MRYYKKVLAAVLVAFLFFVAAFPMPACGVEAPVRYGREKLGQMSNGEDLQYLYDQFASGCGQAKADIQIDIGGRDIDLSTDVRMAFSMFYSDYPEYFWVSGGWKVVFSQQGTTETLTLTPTYTMTGDALTAARAAYEAKVNQLTAGLSGSEYDRAKTLHDRLIDTVTYASSANDQNAYGALVEGKAVCNGYARAYQHLLMKAGITAWYVNGTSNHPVTNTPIGHAWNLVKIDGKWYYTDTTWDDQGENTFYSYFNITTQQLLEDHIIAPEIVDLLPNATATEANYYIKEGRTFAAYDQAKLMALLKKDNNRTQIYVTGDMNGFTGALKENLKSLAADLGATGRYSVSYNAAKLGKGMILELAVTQSGHTHTLRQTVPQVDSSCLSAGTKEYYVCDCGLKFLDESCTQQVTSDSQLEIKAKEHTPSGWKKEEANHWQVCTQCGTEIANTRNSHKDKNGDNQCDACGYALPATDTESSKPTETTQPGASTKPAENTKPTESTGSTQPTQPTGGESTKPTEPTSNESTQPTQPTGNENTQPIGGDDTQPTKPTDGENTQPTAPSATESTEQPATESTQGTETTGTAPGTPDTTPTQSIMTNPTTSPEETEKIETIETEKGSGIWVMIGGIAVVVLGAGIGIVLSIKKKSK